MMSKKNGSKFKNSKLLLFDLIKTLKRDSKTPDLPTKLPQIEHKNLKIPNKDLTILQTNTNSFLNTLNNGNIK
jgi:hypothetical protein